MSCDKRLRLLRNKIALAFLVAGMFMTPASPARSADMADAMIAQGLNEGLRKHIFLDLRDINVVDVLKFLAMEGSINIVTSRNVQGRSTLLLRDVSIGDALEIIVISNSLAYDIKGEIIYVMTEDEYQLLYGKKYNDKRRIRTRSLQYAKPSYALSALEAVQSAIGKIIIDEETGTVIMMDTETELDKMDKLLNGIEGKVLTKTFTLQYADALEVEGQLKVKIEGNAVGSVYSDERSNQVIVTAYPDRMAEVEKVVQALDVKTKAVMIDARILQLTLNPTYDFGLDYQKNFAKSDREALRSLVFRNAFDIATTVSTASSFGSVGQIAVGNASLDEFEAEVKLQEQVQNTKVLASPKLMILNREEARINIGDKVPYVVTTTTGTGTNVSISEEIKFIDVGLLLIVRPIINDEGYITMNIRPEISSQTSTLTTPANATIPQVNTTFIETSVIVKDGVTVILGGLRRDDFTENTRGIPYIQNVPWLGRFFQSREDTLKKTEIVIFLTPTIVTGGVNYTYDPLDIKREQATSLIPPVINSRPVVGRRYGEPIDIKREPETPQEIDHALPGTEKVPMAIAGQSLEIKRSGIGGHSAS
ncbi:MAG: secretin N-terminal domain-containing protein [Candidatus Omnitrophota bacterium]|nr:secretin N-terminal domain-containing protein [Candidatus Omnitrophota bacterium]